MKKYEELKLKGEKKKFKVKMRKRLLVLWGKAIKARDMIANFIDEIKEKYGIARIKDIETEYDTLIKDKNSKLSQEVDKITKNSDPRLFGKLIKSTT